MGPRKRVARPKPSTIKRRALYAKRKQQLVDLLGGACAYCGETDVRKLTFDHKKGYRDWEPRTVHATKRLRIYLEEAKRGDGQLLCGRCNSSKGDSAEDDDSF